MTLIWQVTGAVFCVVQQFVLKMQGQGKQVEYDSITFASKTLNTSRVARQTSFLFTQ
jgi:hypothetical protein